MKRIFLLITAMMLVCVTVHAQDAYSQQMQTAVTKLDNAKIISYWQIIFYVLQMRKKINGFLTTTPLFAMRK